MSVQIPPGYVHGLQTKIPPSERRAIVERVRADPGKRRQITQEIAAEYGVSVRTVRRAIRTHCEETGTYDPVMWSQIVSADKREGRERWRALMDTRDALAKESGQEYAQDAREAQERIERADALVAAQERSQRAERQRRLNEVNRRRNGWT